MPSPSTLARRDEEYGSQIVEALNARELARCDVANAHAAHQGVAEAKQAYAAADQAVKDLYTRFYAEDDVASAAPAAPRPQLAAARGRIGVHLARYNGPVRRNYA